jgi:hypothetical protein
VEKAVFGIANSESQAAAILDELKVAGFSNNDISVLFPDKQGTRDFAHEQHTKAPEGATAGAGTGVVLGGALGWLVGIGALAIPGLGPFIAAGPLMAALAGAGVGAAAGGLTGALIGMGIPEYEAKRYEGKIKEGNILMSVHTEDATERDKAKEIFKRCGADDISYTGESSPGRGERDTVANRERTFGTPRSTAMRNSNDRAGLKAADEYDRDAVSFSEDGPVERKAREAREAVEGPEAEDLMEAERRGKKPARH